MEKAFNLHLYCCVDTDELINLTTLPESSENETPGDKCELSWPQGAYFALDSTNSWTTINRLLHLLEPGASKHDLLCKFKRLFAVFFVSLAIFFTHLLLLKGELKLLTQG